MKLNRRILNEKFGAIPSWLTNRLNAIKPMGKTGAINPKFASSSFGDEATPEYQKKYQKEHPGISSLYDQLDVRGFDLANMSAQEQEAPKSKKEITKILDNGKLPVWLLKDDSTNRTQVYIKSINDGELAVWRSDNCKLDWVAAKELKEHAIRFAILDAPLQDSTQRQERAAWGDEAAGFSGKQRRPDLAGVNTTNGDMDFDKSGYNVAPNRKRLKKGADELRQKKDELRKELTKTLSNISNAKEDIEEIEDTVEEIIEPEKEDVLEVELGKVINSLRRAEYRAKNILFTIEDFSDEEVELIFNQKINTFTVIQRFVEIKKKIDAIKEDVKSFREIYPDAEIHLHSFLTTGDFVSKETGEILKEGAATGIDYVKALIDDYNDTLDNADLLDIDWD